MINDRDLITNLIIQLLQININYNNFEFMKSTFSKSWVLRWVQLLPNNSQYFYVHIPEAIPSNTNKQANSAALIYR